MKGTIAPFVAITLVIVACGGSGGTAAPPAPTGAAPGSGGVSIQLSMDGGPKEADYSLTHTNPCRFNNPSDGAWALTVTFPGAVSDPSIVDLVLIEGSSYVEVWFGNDSFRADDVTFTVNDRGETASLSAQGNATASTQGGGSFPLQISVECDRVARY